MNRTITDAQYIQNEITKQNEVVFCRINGKECGVPMDSANSDYAEILKQVADGDLTIADAD